MKILVIDDEQVHRDHAAIVLRSAGFEVETAGSGVEGLESIARETPALVFCDAMMPELDGFEVLDRMRADPKNDAVPFVFFTAMRFKGVRTEAKERGAQEYIVKPYKAAVLVATAKRLLGLPED